VILKNKIGKQGRWFRQPDAGCLRLRLTQFANGQLSDAPFFGAAGCRKTGQRNPNDISQARLSVCGVFDLGLSENSLGTFAL
jgi:hypothetical protein